MNHESSMISPSSLISAFLSPLISFVITCLSFMIVGLSYRYISIKFGKRIVPSSQKGILITGATSGIGLTLAKHFYKLGFTVFACYYNNQELGYKELDELIHSNEDQDNNNTRQPRLFLIKMDVRSQASIEEASNEINLLLDKYGIGLCRLINNAGISSDGPFDWGSREAMKNVVDTNLTGVIMVTKQFILRIIMSKGRVINVSSAIYMYPANSFSIYGSTKSAVAYFSEALHEDIKIYGASCHCIMPGNFISNSNIILTRLKGLQESELKLSELEKNVYARSIYRYKKGVNKFVRVRLESYGDDLEQLAKTYGVQLSAFKPRGEVAKSGFSKLIESFFESIDGGTKGELMDNTGVSESFEDAVCLKEPPRRVYAGNMFYSSITGPLSEYIPKVLIGPMFFAEANNKSNKKDVNRKSIVFDIKTPKVFYCPQEKQSDYSKMIVKAKPLEKLCEFEGNGKPKGFPTDCYNDVDETEFACDEKKRFLYRLEVDQTDTTPTPGNLDDLDYILSKGSNKKKVSPNSKKL